MNRDLDFVVNNVLNDLKCVEKIDSSDDDSATVDKLTTIGYETICSDDVVDEAIDLKIDVNRKHNNCSQNTDESTKHIKNNTKRNKLDL